MTSYTVQYVLAVDNPENNVRMTVRKRSLYFEIPINYVAADNMTLTQLIAADARRKSLELSTTLNTTAETESSL